MFASVHCSEREIDAVRQKQQLAQQYRESRCRHREKVQQENVHGEYVQKESVQQENVQ